MVVLTVFTFTLLFLNYRRSCCIKAMQISNMKHIYTNLHTFIFGEVKKPPLSHWSSDLFLKKTLRRLTTWKIHWSSFLRSKGEGELPSLSLFSSSISYSSTPNNWAYKISCTALNNIFYKQTLFSRASCDLLRFVKEETPWSWMLRGSCKVSRNVP